MKEEQEGKEGMKKALIFAMMLLMMCLCACTEQKPEDIGSTTVYVRKDGSITATFVEDFSQPHYDMTELQTATEADIAEYNAEAGEGTIEMTFFEVEGNIAKMQLDFANADAYTDFIGEKAFVGTIAEALEAGWDLDVSLTNPLDAEDMIGEHELLTMQDTSIVIVENAVRVRTEGKMLYMSSDAKYIDEYEVDGYDNPDITVILY